MKKLVAVVLNLAFVFGASSAFAGSASLDLQLLEKFKDSAVAKGILKRHCKQMPEIADLCKGELSGADLSEVKEVVKEDLEKQVASEGSEPVASSQAVNVNVSSGDNQTQQVSSAPAAYPGAACVEQATKNINRITSSLNARMAARNAARAAK